MEYYVSFSAISRSREWGTFMTLSRIRKTPLATPCVGALERPFDLAKGRERRVEGRSGDGVARAGSASRQVPVGKPSGRRVGAKFGATPMPGAPTPG